MNLYIEFLNVMLNQSVRQLGKNQLIIRRVKIPQIIIITNIKKNHKIEK